MALLRIEGKNISDEGFGGTNVRDMETGRMSKAASGRLSSSARDAMSVAPATRNARDSNVTSASNTLGSAIAENTLELQSAIDGMDDKVTKTFKSIAESLAKNNPKDALKNIEKLILQVDEETAKKLEKVLNLGQVRKDLSKPKSKFNEFFGADQGSGFVDTIKQGFEGKRFWGEKGAFGTGLGIGGDEGRVEMAREKAQVAASKEVQGEGLKDLVQGLTETVNAKKLAPKEKTKNSKFSSGIDTEGSKTEELLEEIRDTLQDGESKNQSMLGSLPGMFATAIGGLGVFKGLTSAVGSLKSFLGFGADAGEAAAKTAAKTAAQEGTEALAKNVGAEGAEAGAEAVAKNLGGDVAEAGAEGLAKNVGGDVAQASGESLAKAGAAEASEKVALKAGKATVKTAGKEVVNKAIGKAAGKVGLKMVPALGAVVGAGFALGRLFKGDFAGAAAETAGIFMPSATGLAVDIPLMARDVYNEVYGTDDNPFPHDSDMVTAGSGYGEKYKEIYDSVKSFLSDTEELSEVAAEGETPSSDIAGAPEPLASAPGTQTATPTTLTGGPAIGAPGEGVTPGTRTPTATTATGGPSINPTPGTGVTQGVGARNTGPAVENATGDMGSGAGNNTTIVNNNTTNNTNPTSTPILVSPPNIRDQRRHIGSRI
jgi:hypothetical protein